jgi:hypothetical protein
MADVTILNGLVGGVLATVLMTVLMMALGDDSPPPTAMFLATYVGDGDADEYILPGLVLHLLYGTGAGVVLAAVLPAVGVDTVDLVEGLGVGIGYGILLFVGAAVFWMNIVLDMDPEPRDIGLFLLFHLAYGSVLGAVVGAGLV